VHDIYDPVTEELDPSIERRDHRRARKEDRESAIEEIEIRSLLTCESKIGGCAKCYGRNLATGKMVQAGEAVGVSLHSRSVNLVLSLHSVHSRGWCCVEHRYRSKHHAKSQCR